MSNTLCTKCGQLFSERNPRFISASQVYGESPFCRSCVDNCHDSEIADHWCAVDRWRSERTRAAR